MKCKCGCPVEYHENFGVGKCFYGGSFSGLEEDNCGCQKFEEAIEESESPKKETSLECVLDAVDAAPWGWDNHGEAMGAIITLLADISISLKKIAEKDTINIYTKEG